MAKFDEKHRENMRRAKAGGILDTVNDGHKMCPKCVTLLPVVAFQKCNRRSNGLQLWCKDCLKLHKNQSYHNGRRDAVRRLSRESALRRQYGLSLEAYNRMVEDRAGLCDICKRPPIKGGNQFVSGYLVVDHCHSTGRVRGLLCNECNLGISKFQDNAEYLASAIRYLKE